MRIIGIDPGTAKTGYAVLDILDYNSQPEIVEVSCINTSKDSAMHKRLQKLHSELEDVIKRHNPQTMILEKLFFNTNTKTAISVGQARGIYMLLAAKNNLALFEYTALEAKYVVTGYGRSTKKEMQEAVKTFFGLNDKIKPDDANDAIAIALCYLDKDCTDYSYAISKN